MAIRFQCASCSQPIEVDDELARQVVACPYCRKTIAAPLQSTLPDPGQVPAASPLGVPRTGPANALPSPSWTVDRLASANALALVAFSFACTVLALHILTAIILSRHGLEFEEFQRTIEKSGPGFSDQLRAMNEYMKDRGGVLPSWLVGFAFLSLGSVATWMAALVCGLIAVRRPRRRGFAIAALMICALLLLLNCAGGMLGS